MIQIDFSFKYAEFRFSQVELKQSTFQIWSSLYKLFLVEFSDLKEEKKNT